MRLGARIVIALSATALAFIAGCYSSDSATGDPASGAGRDVTAATIPAGPALGLVEAGAFDAAITGRVQALADLGDRFVVFGDRGALAIAGGAVAASAGGITEWRSAATVPAADGTGVWALGATAEGKVARLHEAGRIENVGLRYGVAGDEKALAIVSMSETSFAIALEHGVVVVDNARAATTRFDLDVRVAISASATKVAGVVGDDVFVLDTATGKRTTLRMPGVKATAFDSRGRLIALTERELAREDGPVLRTVLRREDVALDQLVVSGPRIWFAAGTELWALDHDTVRRATAGSSIGARIAGTAGGDVWIIGDKLTRFRIEPTAEERAWIEKVLPIQDRMCKECHSAEPTSGIDLSSFAAWGARRAAIADRVLGARTMPPPPRQLTAAEVDAVRAFADGK